jgi:hypothetical protein
MEGRDETGAERVARLAILGQSERCGVLEARRGKFEVKTKVGWRDGEAVSAIAGSDPRRPDFDRLGTQRAQRVRAVLPNVADVGP